MCEGDLWQWEMFPADEDRADTVCLFILGTKPYVSLLQSGRQPLPQLHLAHRHNLELTISSENPQEIASQPHPPLKMLTSTLGC